jgi:hypothetical protein
MNKIQGLLVLASMALLVGCGEGDGGGSGSDSSDSSTNPIVIKKEISYQLSPNRFYDSYETGETKNQFNFSAKKDEKVFISYSAPSGEAYPPINRCYKMSPKSYLTVTNSSGNKEFQNCDGSLVFTADANENYRIKYGFESGVFNFTSLNVDSFLTNPQGSLGTPSNPKNISFESRNSLNNNHFGNYYKFQAVKGQKINIDTIYNTLAFRDIKMACNTNSNILYDSKYNFIDNVSCNPYEAFEFEIPEDGYYIVKVGYIPPSAGYFTAALYD